MAFIKKLNRFNVEAEYLVLTKIWIFDKLTREAQFEFALYKDKATARLPVGHKQREPIVATAAKLRLTREKFDLYFGPDAPERERIEAQVYRAARAETVESWAGKLDLTDALDD